MSALFALTEVLLWENRHSNRLLQQGGIPGSPPRGRKHLTSHMAEVRFPQYRDLRAFPRNYSQQDKFLSTPDPRPSGCKVPDKARQLRNSRHCWQREVHHIRDTGLWTGCTRLQRKEMPATVFR